MKDDRQLVGEFAQLAQVLAASQDETSRLQVAVDSALSLVRKCDHAGITINDKRGLITRVSSDDIVRRANDLQHELGEGPCLDVMREQDTLVSADLARERRWPAWAARVYDELGVGSMMSILVYNDALSFGAVSLYAGRGECFDADDVAVGHALAGHLAVVMTSGRQIDQLGLALNNRTLIGQATGLVMGRFSIDADQAFDYLRRLSSHSNRKLTDVCGEIVRTRKVPEPR